jgi:SHS2 domain-containing protein
VGFEFLGDIAIADLAFRAWGKSLEEVFCQAGRATMAAMVAELESVEARQECRVELRAADAEMLLFDFLHEIVYFKDAERLLLLPARVEIKEQEGFFLEGLLRGEELDPGRHPLLVDVKAVTLHRFSLRRREEGWQVEVVLDI